MKHTAIYIRVSTGQQSTDSQKDDLKKWLKTQDFPEVRWYQDKATGKNMNRPGWRELAEEIETRQVERLIVWRLDRLGRTASGLCKLFEKLQEKQVNFISLRDAIDLSTAAGRLMAHVLASVAAYETEIRGERVKAGQDFARNNICLDCKIKGKPLRNELGNVIKTIGEPDRKPKCTYICPRCRRQWQGRFWGGAKKGVHKKVTKTKLIVIKDLRLKGYSLDRIAETVGLSRTYLYSLAKQYPGLLNGIKNS